jgi:hypothetical protein
MNLDVTRFPAQGACLQKARRPQARAWNRETLGARAWELQPDVQFGAQVAL